MRGKRAEAVRLRDNHVEFFKFPADLEQSLTDPPNTDYLWW